LAGERIREWLSEWQTTIAVICPVGAALVGVGLSSSPGPGLVVGGIYVVLLAMFAALPAIAVRENRLRQRRAEAEKFLRRVLLACASSFGHPEIHIRCNIMRYSKDRSRRKVDAATAFNMDGDPDRDLEIDATAGASGEVEIHRAPAYGDLTQAAMPGAPGWGMRPHETAKVRATLKSILSVPVFSPSNPAGPLLATLQVDSDEPVEVVGFADLDLKGGLAQTFADVVGVTDRRGREMSKTTPVAGKPGVFVGKGSSSIYTTSKGKA
jgi:hypothetical protein